MYVKSAIIIHKDNKYLLIQENNPIMFGRWNWPQGKLEANETPEEAAIREGKEETGLDLQIEGKVSVLTDTFPDTKEIHVFLATATHGPVKIPLNEIQDAKWFSLEEIENMEDLLVGKWVLEIIKTIE